MFYKNRSRTYRMKLVYAVGSGGARRIPACLVWLIALMRNATCDLGLGCGVGGGKAKRG